VVRDAIQAAVDESLRQQRRRWRRSLLWAVPLALSLVLLIAVGVNRFGERPFGIAVAALGAVFLPAFFGLIGMGGVVAAWESRGDPFPRRRVALFAALGFLVWAAIAALLVASDAG
jgi:hypothetical protein